MANTYLAKGNLKVAPPVGGFAWLDTGTNDSLEDAGVLGMYYKNEMLIS